MLQEAIEHEPAEFSVQEARRIVQDLFEPSPAIYWTDLLLAATVGFTCFALLRTQETFSWGWIAIYIGAVLALYRAGLFTHELVHLRTGTFFSFRVAWNLLIGIPFLMPSFTYDTHRDHHARNNYATKDDGEYLPLGAGPPWKILWYLAQSFIVSVLPIIRFGLITPLCWISPRLRTFVQQRFSSLVMDPTYVRPLPTSKELRVWRVLEMCCFLFICYFATLLLLGIAPWGFLARVYAVGCGVALINEVRTIGAHRFRFSGDHEVTFLDQLLDSVNFPYHPISGELWAPVGLRYHALHHLFPSMPYHNLGKAHRRLMAQLPADSPYRQTVATSLPRAILDLWQSAHSSTRVTTAATSNAT